MGNIPVRVLSLPCSTGEEPYSIAITLLENGLKENDFEIDAQDISKRALRKARRAIYGKHSFREPGKFNLEKYFRTTHSGKQLLPIIRDRVDFFRSNILKDMIIPEPEYYDIIFCRNLLIYFDRLTQKNVLDKLHFMLKPGGTLFVGHAETAEIDNKLFTKVNKPKTFSYTKKTLGMNSNKTEKYDQKNQLISIYNNLVEVTKRDVELSKKISSPGNKPIVSSKKINTVKENDSWKEIENMIEKGQLRDASILCEKRLKQAPDDAQVYYYLAIISNIEGGFGAAELLLKKAVYLDPNHHKALGLFCLLAEQRGDTKLARSLKRRESRARKREGTL
jgi:chemotaxis protein methyltransferase WspC